ncbi:M16 family metallopeptidase [Chamaesiphon minutus]|uniref:Putative Zn-dependent peptidase n=1 Tax=Chamaesiphon minutus (strain ATCC 27169 / PCC 6605) TaxID=1173020 RepID=K9UPR7_CHAP6|nr:pitrilysin family protein [Chamaesiphon minutus]AFY96199.1 putative Zn-dependent peptidase [Chamaesiphon minutus PCC 6605]
MLKIRDFWVSWRRYRFGMLLFGVCLSAILASPQVAMSTQPIPTVTTESAPGAEVAKQPLARPSKSPTLPTKKPTTLTATVKKTVLGNGMTVLTKEVRNAPVVTVQVWYKIGSRNEAPGVNGIAHQLEHMLFKGTKDRPIQFGRLFSALGSSFNAFTSYDQTAYYGTVEKNKLSSLLVLEADRMQNSTIDTEKLTGEKRVVISELQGYENSPSYRLDRAVKRAAFPNTPYGLTVGGTKADVEKFTVEQVRSYYDSYYAPNNATLVVVGDFDTAKLMAKVEETFGKVPRREIKVTKSPPTNIKPTRRLTLKEPGTTQLTNQVYPLPDANHPDVPAIDVMNYVLTEGRSSRMYQSIVETGIATSLDGGAINLAAGGWYEISSIVEVGKSLPKLEAAIEKEIKLLQTKGATAGEIARAKAQLKAAYLLSNRDINSQARQLGNDQTTTGDYQFTDKYLAGVERVTLADVQRVAKKYLQPNLKTIGFFEPTQITDKAAAAATGGKTADNFAPGAPVDPSELAKYLPPLDPDTSSQTQALPQEVQLKNGLRVFLLPDSSTPTVTLSGSIQAGTEYDSPNKAGLASLTAANIMSGTQTQTALTIAKTLESRGAGLAFGASREGVGLGGNALSKDLPILLQTLGDVVQNANFPQPKFELSRQRALTSLKLELDSPNSVARRKFQQTIYPKDHPFTIFPTAETLSALTAADLQTFYRQHYLPSNTILAIVGDFKVAEVTALLESTLGKWSTTAESVKLKYPIPQLPTQQVLVNPALPGKTQAITLLGNKAIDRKDPRYYSALVLNQILGGDTLSSRLGTEIRDRLGLTYGIYSSFAAGKRQGTFIISMQTAPEDAQKATQSTIALLKDLQTKGVTAAEVANSKRSIASNYTVELASPDEIAGATLGNAIYGLNPNEISEFPKKIQAVTLEQVNQVAKELIQPDRLVVVTAGPPKK